MAMVGDCLAGGGTIQFSELTGVTAATGGDRERATDLRDCPCPYIYPAIS